MEFITWIVGLASELGLIENWDSWFILVCFWWGYLGLNKNTNIGLMFNFSSVYFLCYIIKLKIVLKKCYYTQWSPCPSHMFDKLVWVDWELRFTIYFSLLFMKGLLWFQINISTLSWCLILRVTIFVII